MYAHASMATVIAALGGSLLRPEVEQRHRWLEGLIEIIRDVALPKSVPSPAHD